MASTFQNPYAHEFSPRLRSDHVGPRSTDHTRPELQAENSQEWSARPGLLHQPSLASRPVFKTLVFRRRAFRTDVTLWNTSATTEVPEYFAACTEWKSKTPDVILHSGADKTGPVVGVAHFRYSRHVTFGMGNPADDSNDVAWEEMRNVSKWLTKSKYKFQVTVTDSEDWDDLNGGAPPAQRGPRTRRFLWSRTGDTADGVEGISGKLSLRNFRLTDQDGDQVVAVFVASNLNAMKKKGELRIFERLSPSLERAVVLTCASISEKMSRD